MDINSLNLFLTGIIASLIVVLIYFAKKKYFTKPNLFDLLNWSLLTMIPTTAAIPVILSIFPKSQLALAPYWIGMAIWILIAATKKVNEEEKPYINTIVLRMGLYLFFIGIFGHLLLYFLSL